MTRSGLILDDRYRLEERIAAGGVGQVWRATDLLLQRPVAVKLLRPEYADHPDTLDRFRKEARHAGAVSHPGIAQVYDYGYAGPGASAPYLVMEYVDGPSLADLLAVEPVDPLLALDVVAQAAAGLGAAHQAGLVHRDVKPGNILIGPDGRVKITDFGIAHAAGQAPVTAPGLVMGTTQYLAPERIAGGTGSPASDLYALGIVLHECLTGLPPFEGTPAEMMAAHLYLPLPDLPSGTPPEVEDLIGRLAAKNPERRLGDAREVAERAARLRDALRGGAPGGQLAGRDRADTAGTPAAGPERSTRPASLGDARPPEAAGDRPPRRDRRRAAVLAAVAALIGGLGLAGLLGSGMLAGTPTADSGPGSAPSVSGPAAPGAGTRPATPAPHRTAAASTSVSPRPATGHRKTGHGTPAPSPTGHSPRPGTTPTPGGPGTPTSTPSGTPTGTPSGTPTPKPTPSPTGRCVLGILCPSLSL